MKIELDNAVGKQEFLQMARDYFRELNPEFTPGTDWNDFYFAGVTGNSACRLRWIKADQIRAGFVLYGIEQHRFLPRRIGVIYELYVLPQHRNKGIARACAQLVLADLRKSAAAKIQLEIVIGNAPAQKFWTGLGFSKVSERFVLAHP